ncbi:hypothetical protein AB0D71_46245 [Streptomyces avermitilis]|uniref:hypothetical protein n=1 Tax=Streptomyces avermitilis TaxID=33903 RepID=UPI0033FF0AEC
MSRSIASITGRYAVLLHLSSNAPSNGTSIRRQCPEYEDRNTVRTRALYRASFAAASAANAFNVDSPATG